MLIPTPQCHAVDVIVRADHTEIIATIRPIRSGTDTSLRCASRYADLRRLAQRYTPRHLSSLSRHFPCRVV